MRLVLSDGHPMFLDALASALELQGHEVLAKCSPDPVVLRSLIRKHRPDICMVDPCAPESQPVDQLSELKATSPATAVVLMLPASTEYAWTLYDDGDVDALVSKSIAVDRLVRSLHDVCAGVRPLTGVARHAGTPEPELQALTPREREVLDLMVEGASTERMAMLMCVSTNTVRTHVHSVLRKLGVSRRAQAVRRAVEIGLIQEAGAA